MSLTQRLQELQRDYALEQHPDKKQAILEQILAQTRLGWEQLFSALSENDNPQRLLLMIADLNRLFEERRAQLTKPDTPSK